MKHECYRVLNDNNATMCVYKNVKNVNKTM